MSDESRDLEKDRGRSRESDANGDELRASYRLDELGKQVSRAKQVIADLRESNYQLSGEVASLKRELEALQASRSHATTSSVGDEEPDEEEGESEAADSGLDSESELESVSESEPEATTDARLEGKLAVLSKERQTVRRKVESLLARIEAIESKL